MAIDQATLTTAYNKIVAAARAQGVDDADIPSGEVTFSTPTSDDTIVLITTASAG